MKKVILFFCAAMAMMLPLSFSPALAQTDAKAAKSAQSAQHDLASSAKSCSDCAATCEKTLAYFHKKGGKYAEAKNVDALKDCISLCKASADLKSRKSANALKLDTLCNEVCQQCAQICKDLKDPALKECIDSCETCHKCCG